MSTWLVTLKVVVTFLFMILYYLLWIFFKLVQTLSWKFRKISKPPPNDTARVMRIRCRYKFTSILPSDKMNFFATHESFADPNVILRLPTVSLYCINEKEAFFVQCSKTDHELVSAHSFYYQAQFLYATKVIVIPISEFHRVAELIGKPKSLLKAGATEYKEDSQLPPVGDIVFLYSTGRCGSTLLTNMLEVLPRTLSLSEPDSFTNLIGFKGSLEEKQKLLYSTVIFEAKRLLSKDVDRIIIKFRSQCTPQAHIINKIFPDVHLLFMYRNPQPTILSFKRVFADINLFKMYDAIYLYRWLLSGIMKRYIKETAPKNIPMYAKEEFIKKIRDDFIGMISYQYVGNISKFVELYEEGVSIKAVKYETLLNNSQKIFNLLCEHIQVKLTAEQFQAVQKTMEKDSQAGSDISRSVKGKKNLSMEEKEMITYVLSFHQLLNNDAPQLPGTL